MSVASSLKRTKSEEVASVDKSPQSKRVKRDENANQKSPKNEKSDDKAKRSVTPSTKNSLEAFSAGMSLISFSFVFLKD